MLPSGGQVHLHEIIIEDGGTGTVTRLRFVADGFAPDQMAPEATLRDMTFLCESNALDYLTGPVDGQTVIISLADREAPFGVMDSSVAQIFEAFTILDNTCIWEAF